MPAKLALEVDGLGPERLGEPLQIGAGGADAIVPQEANQQIIVAQALALSILAEDDEGERTLGESIGQQPEELAPQQPSDDPLEADAVVFAVGPWWRQFFVNFVVLV